ncbi:MAG: YlxR family protein [Defluviitaleaceae bacterium]|nr:YlxR family protein [Defluviitaleaceae bacterium]
MSARKTPLRRCVGCGQMKPKPELVRIVRTQGGYEVDPSGKRPGRGAYVCVQPVCIVRAQKHKGFERSYKSVFPKELYAALSQEVNRGDS